MPCVPYFGTNIFIRVNAMATIEVADAVGADSNSAFMSLAKKVLPSGTYGNMIADVVIREGRAGHVGDEDGREYVDYVLGSGPMLVGHAHPEVTAAAQSQVALGTTFFATNRHGILLAEEIVDAVPCAFALEWMADFETYLAALDADDEQYMTSLNRSLVLVRIVRIVDC